MQELYSYDDIDDIDDDGVFKEFAEEDSVSKFCIAIYNATKNEPIGSGILLNSDGLFISAGHNFKNPDIKIKAYFDGESYEIELSHIEYDRDSLLDFAVGKLQDFDSQKYGDAEFPILGNCSSINVGSRVNIAGYKSIIVRQADILEDMSMFEDCHLYKQRKEFTIVNPDTSQKILAEQLNGRGIFYMQRGEADTHKGYSGGPVYYGDRIYGIVISHYFLKSDYIKEILRLQSLM